MLVPQVGHCRGARPMYLFPTDGGHASSSHEAVTKGAGCLGSLTLGAHGPLERNDLVVFQHDKEGLQEDDGLAQAGIQVIVSRVDNLPFGGWLGRTTCGEVFHSKPKVASKVADHLFECADL